MIAAKFHRFRANSGEKIIKKKIAAIFIEKDFFFRGHTATPRRFGKPGPLRGL
jgi:hypothetical protein